MRPLCEKTWTDHGVVIKFLFCKSLENLKIPAGRRQENFWRFRKALGVCDAVKGDLRFDLRFGNFEVRVINVGF